MNNFGFVPLTRTLPCLVLMILGCAACAKEPPVEKVVLSPVVVDSAPVRCVDVDAREFLKRTSRPTPPLDKDATRAWIDKLEASEDRKNAAGQRLLKDYAACKGKIETPKTKATS